MRALELHPQKMEIRKFSQGIGFLGYIILSHYLILRRNKKRMFKKISANKEKLTNGLMDKATFNQSLQSYYGVLAAIR
jgi:hypothetical protein